jgi:hypothetical protein
MFQNEYKIIHSALVVRIGHEEKKSGLLLPVILSIIDS